MRRRCRPLVPQGRHLQAVRPIAWPGTISFDVPRAGFRTSTGSRGAEGVIVESGQAAIDGSGWGPIVHDGERGLEGSVRPERRPVPANETATVDGLIAAMRSWPDFEVSASQPVAVDGHAGQLVTISSTRTAADCATQSIWATARWRRDRRLPDGRRRGTAPDRDLPDRRRRRHAGRDPDDRLRRPVAARARPGRGARSPPRHGADQVELQIDPAIRSASGPDCPRRSRYGSPPLRERRQPRVPVERAGPDRGRVGGSSPTGW